MAGPKRIPVPASGQPAPAAATAAITPPASETIASPSPVDDQSAAAPATIEPAVPPPAPAAAPEIAAPAQTETEAASTSFEARVLVAFGNHAVNDIVVASETEIEELWRADKVDPHPDAVAAARDLRA